MDKTDKSFYQALMDNPIAQREMSAVSAGSRVSEMLGKALQESGFTQKDLSEILGITESAVSQTLDGAGNYHIYTIARYLSALGFELKMEFKPASSVTSDKTELKRIPGKVIGLPHPIYDSQIFSLFSEKVIPKASSNLISWIESPDSFKDAHNGFVAVPYKSPTDPVKYSAYIYKSSFLDSQNYEPVA